MSNSPCNFCVYTSILRKALSEKKMITLRSKDVGTDVFSCHTKRKFDSALLTERETELLSYFSKRAGRPLDVWQELGTAQAHRDFVIELMTTICELRQRLSVPAPATDPEPTLDTFEHEP